MNEESTKAVVRHSSRKVRTGYVISDKSDKTILVEVMMSAPHPVYGKVVKKRKKFMAHDENNQAKTGDLVKISETRPLSKRKRWRLLEVLKKAEADEIISDEKPL